MIITLIGVAMFVLGIIGFLYYVSFDTNKDVIGFLSSVGIIIGFLWLLICIPCIILTRCTASNDIYNANLERECIVNQIEYIDAGYEDVSKTIVIQNVYEWNKKVHAAQYWSSNPWTSWFWSKKYVNSLKYIELEE